MKGEVAVTLPCNPRAGVPALAATDVEVELALDALGGKGPRYYLSGIDPVFDPVFDPVLIRYLSTHVIW